MKYYFLVSYLPEVRPDDKKLKFGISDLLEEKYAIASGDWRDLELILLARDIFIIEKTLAGKPVEIAHSLHEPEFWKEQVKSPSDAPVFLEELLENADRDGGVTPQFVNRLYEAYYDYATDRAKSPLLQRFLLFSRDVKNIQAAVRARRLGLAPADNVVGEDEVAEQLGRSNAEDFGLLKEYPWIERLSEVEDPLEMEDVVGEIFWEYIEEQTEALDFEFDVVIAYLLKLQLIERRLGLSEEEGMGIIHRLEEI